MGGYTIANGALIENALGGSGNDVLTGNSAANTLNGGTGADVLIGGLGNDTQIAGDGDDNVIGGDGDDVFAPACDRCGQRVDPEAASASLARLDAQLGELSARCDLAAGEAAELRALPRP